MGRKRNTIPRKQGPSLQKNIWFYCLLDNLKADFKIPFGELSWTSRSETSPSRRSFMLKPPQGRGKVELLHQVKVASRLLFSVRLIERDNERGQPFLFFFFEINSCFALKNDEASNIFRNFVYQFIVLFEEGQKGYHNTKKHSCIVQ